MSISLFTSFVLSSLLIQSVYSHICLNYPPQRGGVPVSASTTPGNALCAVTTAPCGSAAAPNGNSTLVKWYPGQQVSIEIIQNAQHLTIADGIGNFSASYCTENCNLPSSFTNFGVFVNDEANATIPRIIQVTITVPDTLTPGDVIVVQGVYLTSPLEDPPAYYICGDVEIEVAPPDEFSFLGFGLWYVVGAAIIIFVVLVLIIVVIAVVVVKKRKSKYYGGDDYRKDPTRDDEGAKAIPMMNMSDIQRNLMQQAPESYY